MAQGNLNHFIFHLYGEDNLKLVKKFDHLSIQRIRELNTLTFLKRCRDLRICPNFIKVETNLTGKGIQRIIRSTEFALVRNRIQATRAKLQELEEALLKLHLKLSTILGPLLWSFVEKRTLGHSASANFAAKSKHTQKLKCLIPKPKVSVEALQTVVNLSKTDLTNDQMDVLNRGLKFAPTPRVFPTEQFIVSIEQALKRTTLEDGTKSDIRTAVKGIIRDKSLPTSNISKAQRAALAELKANTDFVILPADKGNKTVVLDRTEYETKLSNLLQDPSYRKLNKDPTSLFTRKINKAIKDREMIPDGKKWFLSKSTYLPPRIYGLPKIHKPGVPLRPIVSAIGSPTHALAGYLAKQLRGCVGKSPHHILNSVDFINKLKSVNLKEGDIFFSCDVESLFTKVPIEAACNIIAERLGTSAESNGITELVKLVLGATYFKAQGVFYEQIEGAPMGSPLSPIVANIFMEDFEIKALKEAPLPPTHWWRYVDDTFIVWPHGIDTIPQFVEFLNSRCESIRFTHEVEKNGVLPFLDVLVEQKEGKIHTSVYRKATHSNLYLGEGSCHHPSQKGGTFQTLSRRAITHCSSPDRLNTELNLLRKVAIQNGYKPSIIHTNFPKENRGETDIVKLPTVTLPYVPRTTEKLANLLRKYNFQVTSKPPQKIKGILPSPKDTLNDEDKCGIYEIPCKSPCQKVYIGQTKRSLRVRVGEHKRHWKMGDFHKSAVAQHSWESNHHIKWDSARIISAADTATSRDVIEAMEIYKAGDQAINNSDGVFLSRVWLPLLSRRRKNLDQTHHSTPNKRPRLN